MLYGQTDRQTDSPADRQTGRCLSWYFDGRSLTVPSLSLHAKYVNLPHLPRTSERREENAKKKNPHDLKKRMIEGEVYAFPPAADKYSCGGQDVFLH